jgi:hypothetical protein
MPNYLTATPSYNQGLKNEAEAMELEYNMARMRAAMQPSMRSEEEMAKLRALADYYNMDPSALTAAQREYVKQASGNPALGISAKEGSAIQDKKKPDFWQYAKAVGGGALDSLAFGLLKDSWFTDDQTKGAFKAGQWGGTLLSLAIPFLGAMKGAKAAQLAARAITTSADDAFRIAGSKALAANVDDVARVFGKKGLAKFAESSTDDIAKALTQSSDEVTAELTKMGKQLRSNELRALRKAKEIKLTGVAGAADDAAGAADDIAGAADEFDDILDEVLATRRTDATKTRFKAYASKAGKGRKRPWRNGKNATGPVLNTPEKMTKHLTVKAGGEQALTSARPTKVIAKEMDGLAEQLKSAQKTLDDMLASGPKFTKRMSSASRAALEKQHLAAADDLTRGIEKIQSNMRILGKEKLVASYRDKIKTIGQLAEKKKSLKILDKALAREIDIASGGMTTVKNVKDGIIGAVKGAEGAGSVDDALMRIKQLGPAEQKTLVAEVKNYARTAVDKFNALKETIPELISKATSTSAKLAKRAELVRAQSLAERATEVARVVEKATKFRFTAKSAIAGIPNVLTLGGIPLARTVLNPSAKFIPRAIAGATLAGVAAQRGQIAASPVTPMSLLTSQYGAATLPFGGMMPPIGGATVESQIQQMQNK